MRRRPLLLALTAAAATPRLRAAELTARPLEFPGDFGAHPQQRIEWWYLTGHLAAADAGEQADPQFGFQVTFFRARTPVNPAHPSRFAARQLLFAHVALTDLTHARMHHDQRIARTGFGLAEFALAETRLMLHDWTLQRSGPAQASRYDAKVRSTGFSLDLQCRSTQPVLRQGEQGWSRKAPQPAQASLYYSQPQLEVQGSVQVDARQVAVQGRAWLDHEWSDSLLDAPAVGWDWIGMNLHDGSALMAFRLRRADGQAHYAGGSFRRPGAPPRIETSDSVHFKPLRWWTSPHSAARYPVHWAVQTTSGTFEVKALLDDQELDSRASTGAIYWEGLSELLDSAGKRIGLGYLEMTGYAAALRL
ncbi:MAG: carotenoid 1,2-hydratase [Burkholderiaceae bacterium]